MVDKVVKVCPQCGKHNGARRDKCENCGGSLAGVLSKRASSLPPEQVFAASERPMQPAAQEFVAPPPREAVPENVSFAEKISDAPQTAPAMKKICPLCQAINPANITTCSGCSADLSSARAIPEDKVKEALARLQGTAKPTPSRAPAPAPTPPAEADEMVRLCENPDCLHINPANKRVCENCGAPVFRLLPRREAEAEIKKPRLPKKPEPITPGFSAPFPDGLPDTQPQAPKATSARFVSLDGRFSYQVPEGTASLGRLGEMKDYLKEKKFVSRSHAALTFADGHLSVTDEESTNGTYVNGVKLKPHETQQLRGGDTLGLGAGSDREAEDRENAAFFKVELK